MLPTLHSHWHTAKSFNPAALKMCKLSILTDVFPGGPGLTGTRMSQFWILLELRMTEVVATTGAIRPANSSQIVTTNKPTPSFFISRALKKTLNYANWNRKLFWHTLFFVIFFFHSTTEITEFTSFTHFTFALLFKNCEITGTRTLWFSQQLEWHSIRYVPPSEAKRTPTRQSILSSLSQSLFPGKILSKSVHNLLTHLAKVESSPESPWFSISRISHTTWITLKS